MHEFLIWTTIISTFSICFAVWRMFVSALKNTDLEAGGKRHFAAVSAAYMFGWYALMFALAGAGVYTASPYLSLPSISIGFGVTLPIVIGLIMMKLSPMFDRVVRVVPAYLLISVQFYRVLGIIFIGFYMLGELPAEFALLAGIGDIIVGAGAPVVGYFLAKNYRGAKSFAVVWNTFGILDLIIAVACGFLSSPSPFQILAMDNPNQLVTKLPLVLVPVFAVPLSILLHIVSLRGLKDQTQKTGILESNGFILPPVKS